MRSGNNSHLLIQQPISFLHVIEQGGQVRTENTVDTEFVRGSNKEFARNINLKASRFSDVNVSVDHHAVRISKPGLSYFVNSKSNLSVSNYLDRTARSAGLVTGSGDVRRASAMAFVARQQRCCHDSYMCFIQPYIRGRNAHRGDRMIFSVQDGSSDTIAAQACSPDHQSRNHAPGFLRDLLLVL